MIRMQVDKNRVDLRDDTRKCLFCEGIGDGTQGLTGRLLNVDANEWVHVVRTESALMMLTNSFLELCFMVG